MGQFTRRNFLHTLGTSVGALGLSSYLAAAGGRSPAGRPRAKRMIFLFLSGGPSHVDLLDPKPALKKYAGQRPAGADLRTERVTGGLLPSSWTFEPCGDSGLAVSELL